MAELPAPDVADRQRKTARDIWRNVLAGSKFVASGVRYSLVSVSCVVLNNVLLILLAAAGFHYLTATALVVPPMLAVGYLLQARFAFSEPPRWPAFIKYSGAILTNLPLWVASLAIFCDAFHLPMVAASPMTTVLLVLWNYLGTRWAIIGRASLRQRT